jgi:hypothetical protein
MCDLCEAVPEMNLGPFFLLTCRNCQVPMVVLKEHRENISINEYEQFLHVVSWLFPAYEPRGIGTGHIHDHWHEHLCPGGVCPIER